MSNTYFRIRGESDRVFSKGYKVEVVYAIISKGVPLFRTEGVGDISTVNMVVDKENYELPVILPEKIQAKLRRTMLEVLRREYSSFDTDTKKHIMESASKAKYKKVSLDKLEWNCFIAPPMQRTQATDIGMCGYCPSCTTMGNITDDTVMDDINTAYGIKSRVAHDIAFSCVEYRQAVMEMTHNKVAEGVSYTGQSLYSEVHVAPGVVFIGKSTLYDVTQNEFAIIVDSLSRITRMGGRETKDGSVEVKILGVKFSDRETVSSYDLAREVLKASHGKMTDPEEVISKVREYLKNKGFQDVAINGGVIKIGGNEIKVNYKEAWLDSLDYAGKIREFIERAENKKKSTEESGQSGKGKGRGGKKKEGEDQSSEAE